MRKVIEAVVDEARWVTFKNNNHVLVSNKGEPILGGPGSKKKLNKSAIDAALNSAKRKKVS